MKFAERVYEKLRNVPKGRVTTYKELAAALGTQAYRAVGTAMRCNPYAPDVPCHRVVKSDGSIGGFKGHQSGATIEEKIKMLSEEGVTIENGYVVDFDKKIYHFA